MITGGHGRTFCSLRRGDKVIGLNPHYAETRNGYDGG
jgi:hypothetical protein